MTVVLKAIRLNILQFARDLRLIRLHSLYMSCVLSCFFGSQIIFNLVHYVVVVVLGQISDALFFNFSSVILINELRICWSLVDVWQNLTILFLKIVWRWFDCDLWHFGDVEQILYNFIGNLFAIFSLLNGVKWEYLHSKIILLIQMWDFDIAWENSLANSFSIWPKRGSINFDLSNDINDTWFESFLSSHIWMAA